MPNLESIIDKVTRGSLKAAVEYPIGANDRTKKGLDVLAEGIEKKQIWNVDFIEATEFIGRNYEEAYNAFEKTVEPNIDGLHFFYMLLENGNQLQSLNKSIRTLDTFIKRPSFKIPQMPSFIRNQLSPEQLQNSETQNRNREKAVAENMEKCVQAASEMKRFMESWLVVLSMKEQAKPFVVKGRKPSDAPKKDVYMAPVPSAQSIGKVRDVLAKVTQMQKEELTKRYAKYYYEVTESFVIAYPETTVSTFTENIRKFRAERGLNTDMVSSLIDVPASGVRMKPDAMSKATDRAAQVAKQITDTFMTKNLAKIAPVVEMKAKSGKALKEGSIANGTFTNFTFEGSLRFEFDDGTGFIVINKSVSKWSSGGRMRGNGGHFYQFPTTFHNVKYPDGKIVKMVPWEEMIETWAKA